MSNAGTTNNGAKTATGNNKVTQTKATMTVDAYNKKKAELNKKLAEARKKYNQAAYKRDILDGLASGVTTAGGLLGKDSATAPVITVDLAKKNARAFMMTRSDHYKNTAGDYTVGVVSLAGSGSSFLPSVTQLGRDIDAVQAAWRASGKTFKEEEQVYLAQRKEAAAEMRRLKAELSKLDKTYNDALANSKTNNEVKKPRKGAGGKEVADKPKEVTDKSEEVADKSKEEVLQTDENGNKLIRITDANGNQSFVVEDKEKNRKSIKDDEIKKTSVKPEDIQEAIQKGDWKTLLALFLKAIGERDKQAQLGNDGQGNAPAQPTVDEYRDKDNIFKVKKVNGNIASISMQEGNMSFELTDEHFKKVGVDPAKVEEALKAGRYDEASLNLLDVGYKSGVIKRPDPVLEIKGSDIILKDQYFLTGERNKPFVLNEQYLIDNCGMKKSKAEKAMENLRAIAASDKTNQAATQIVAQYFSKESPAPKMPEVQTTYGSPKLNRNPGGKVISITVKDAAGKEKELGYKDFAQAYGCSPEEAKKLRKECVRAIKNGGNVDGVLNFVANNSEGKSKFWTKTATKIGTYVVGAAAVGVSVYTATGGFKKKGDNNEETPQPSTVDLETVKTDKDTTSSEPADDTTKDTTKTTSTRSTPTTHSNPTTPFIKTGNTR